MRTVILHTIYFFQIISYDSPRGGVSVITEKGDVTASFLVVQHAKPSDSGTYSCSPSLGDTVSVNVHVLRGNTVCSSDFCRLCQYCNLQKSLVHTVINACHPCQYK